MALGLLTGSAISPFIVDFNDYLALHRDYRDFRLMVQHNTEMEMQRNTESKTEYGDAYVSMQRSEFEALPRTQPPGMKEGTRWRRNLSDSGPPDWWVAEITSTSDGHMRIDWCRVHLYG